MQVRSYWVLCRSDHTGCYAGQQLSCDPDSAVRALCMCVCVCVCACACVRACVCVCVCLRARVRTFLHSSTGGGATVDVSKPRVRFADNPETLTCATNPPHSTPYDCMHTKSRAQKMRPSLFCIKINLQTNKQKS